MVLAAVDEIKPKQLYYAKILLDATTAFKEVQREVTQQLGVQSFPFDFQLELEEWRGLQRRLDPEMYRHRDDTAGDEYFDLCRLASIFDTMTNPEVRRAETGPRDKSFIQSTAKHAKDLVQQNYNPFEEISTGFIIDYAKLPDFIEHYFELYAEEYCPRYPLVGGDRLAFLRQLSSDPENISAQLPSYSIHALREYAMKSVGFFQPYFSAGVLSKGVLNICAQFIDSVETHSPFLTRNRGDFVEVLPNLDMIISKMSTSQTLHIGNYADNVNKSKVMLWKDPDRQKAAVTVSGLTTLGFPLMKGMLQHYSIGEEMLNGMHQATELSHEKLVLLDFFGIQNIQRMPIASYSKLLSAKLDGSPAIIKACGPCPVAHFGRLINPESVLPSIVGYTIRTDQGPQPIEKYLPQKVELPFDSKHLPSDIVVFHDFTAREKALESTNADVLLQVFAGIHADMIINVHKYAAMFYQREQPSFDKILEGVASTPLSRDIPLEKIESLRDAYGQGARLSLGRHLLCYDIVQNIKGNLVYDFHEARLTSYSRFFAGLGLELGEGFEMRTLINNYKAYLEGFLVENGVHPEKYIGRDSWLGEINSDRLLEEIPFTTLQILLKEVSLGKKIWESPGEHRFISRIEDYVRAYD